MRNQTPALVLAALAGVAASATAQGQVVNGGFETGSFAPWIQTGDPGYTTVQTDVVHSGLRAGRFGPLTPGGIKQVVPANAGDPVHIEFWYQAQGDNNSFSATLGGVSLISLFNDVDHASWTLFTFDLNAPAANPLLEFTFTNPPLYDYLDDVSAVAGVQSACCLFDTTCIMTNAAGCALEDGVFHSGQTCGQVACPPPALGACCLPDGTCVQLNRVDCGAAIGVYHGDNLPCSSVSCPFGIYTESGDADDLPATAAVTGSSGGGLTQIFGNLGTGDADMYQIQVCDAAHFRATTANPVTGDLDTMLMVFKADGTGVTLDDDDPMGTTNLQSRLGPTNVAAAGNGLYYLAIAPFTKLPTDASAQQIWIDDNTPGHEYRRERTPDGPGAANPIAGWLVSTHIGGTYQIDLAGVCFPGGASCYANCDNSTHVPVLNANDFNCFLNKYAAADSYANCDGSTHVPVLNANDFNCFLNKYAAGCS